MNKDDILEKSKKENLLNDERDKEIDMIANQNAYLFIMGIFLILGVVALVQKFLTGIAFADYNIFGLVFLIGWTGRNITKYYYYKQKKYLITFILCFLVSIVQLANIFIGYRAYNG